MADNMDRREFLKLSGGASAGAFLANFKSDATLFVPARPNDGPIRIGVIGTGNRGRSLLANLLLMPGLEFPALCDIDLVALGQAQDMVVKAGRPKPEGYSQGPEDFQRLLGRDDIDAVVIATSWDWHTPMAVYAMKNGKYAARRGARRAMTFEECWELVDTHEATGVPCMMLENWSFRRDNLAVLNMIRKGLFGEIVHCHCAHSHDCIDHWFFDPEGHMRWGGRYLINHNRDQYPTHAVGPVLSWMDIDCGDYFDTAVTGQSPAGDQRLLHAQVRPEASLRQGRVRPGRHRHDPDQDQKGQHDRHQLRHAAPPPLRQPLDDPGHARPLRRATERRLSRRTAAPSTTSGSRSRPTRRSTTTSGGGR